MRNAAVSMFLFDGDAEVDEAAPASETVRAPGRMTTPSPATLTRQTFIPSSRPTSVPDIDVAALASCLSLRDTSAPAVTFEDAVPVRASTSAELHGLGFEAAFLLAHVDGCSTIGQIAEHAQVPVSRALEAFRAIFELGGVTLVSGHIAPPRDSGVCLRAAADTD